MRSAGALRFELVPPEPARFWIRHAPRSWPGPAEWWIDIARAEPAAEDLRVALVELHEEPQFHDVVYVPPVEPGAGLIQQQILQRCADLGVPAVQQVFPNQPIGAGPGPVVVDLTESLLRRRLADLLIPQGTWAVWPLLPGLTDGNEIRERGLERLAKTGAAGVMPIAPALTPAMRRRLAEFGSAASYSEIFHKENLPQLSEFARAVAASGLEVYTPRPALAESRRAPNRALAAHFAVLGELWLGCGRSEGRAQVFFSTSRRLDEEPLDVGELARRGGLSGIGWIDEEGLSEVRQIAIGGSSSLLRELQKAFYGNEGRFS
jgi:hypothetical protein